MSHWVIDWVFGLFGELYADGAGATKRANEAVAIRIVKLFRSLPKTDEARVLGRQLLRSGTSVAANYRAVCRARSKAEFIAKMGVVVEESDETVFWLELLTDSGIVPPHRLQNLLAEAQQLVAIFAASQRTARIANSPARK